MADYLLLSHSGNSYRVTNDYIVRIGDFGLSRDIHNKDYYRPITGSTTALPAKWMALESLQNFVFTTQSDVVSRVIVELYYHRLKLIHAMLVMQLVEYFQTNKLVVASATI